MKERTLVKSATIAAIAFFAVAAVTPQAHAARQDDRQAVAVVKTDIAPYCHVDMDINHLGEYVVTAHANVEGAEIVIRNGRQVTKLDAFETHNIGPASNIVDVDCRY
ncbi:hypothetical protein [Vibrio sp. WXL210]|uniref:hypothetical protein n=1 Tax=Vibrio sp. WXL210 TaxID=3450709 RepID=UPI003EC62D88